MSKIYYDPNLSREENVLKLVRAHFDNAGIKIDNASFIVGAPIATETDETTGANTKMRITGIPHRGASGHLFLNYKRLNLEKGTETNPIDSYDEDYIHDILRGLGLAANGDYQIQNLGGGRYKVILTESGVTKLKASTINYDDYIFYLKEPVDIASITNDIVNAFSPILDKISDHITNAIIPGFGPVWRDVNDLMEVPIAPGFKRYPVNINNVEFVDEVRTTYPERIEPTLIDVGTVLGEDSAVTFTYPERVPPVLTNISTVLGEDSAVQLIYKES